MKFRIVTVSLTVALGLWCAGLAFGQAEDNFPELPELVAPSQELDGALQSDFPLQGAFDDSPMQGSIAETVAPRPPAAAGGSDWVYSLRHWFSRAPWTKIALGFGMLCALFAAGWAMTLAVRRRARRASRRLPRSSGGTPLRGLEEVVASMQFADSKNSRGRPLPEPSTGQE